MAKKSVCLYKKNGGEREVRVDLARYIFHIREIGTCVSSFK